MRLSADSQPTTFIGAMDIADLLKCAFGIIAAIIFAVFGGVYPFHHPAGVTQDIVIEAPIFFGFCTLMALSIPAMTALEILRRYKPNHPLLTR